MDKDARIQAVREAATFHGYRMLDTVVHCKCGVNWYLHDFNEAHVRLVLNGMRLHRQRGCDRKY